MRVWGDSLEILRREHNQMDFTELSRFRGPILKSMWTTHTATSKAEEDELCRDLFTKALSTVNGTLVPPKEIPENLRDMYRLGDKMALQQMYFGEEVFNGVRVANWTTDLIDHFRTRENTCGYYNRTYCYHSLKQYVHHIHNHDVAIIGSADPWAEAAFFNLHAKKVITIEYTKIYSDYPHYTPYHPSEAARQYLHKKWEPVDVIFSYSSLEHDGLGRYGDPLSPFADLESIARARCLLKPGGVFFFGVPVGSDTIVWNAHRIYGKYRLVLATLGWKILDMFPRDVKLDGPIGEYDQPVLVLQKPPASR